ncbi:MAG: preprotein translocase SecE subunit [Chlamydiales bacterium]|jgi:preprotein translocase SecE subunit
MARMAAFWVLAILIFYGCTSLRRELSAFFPDALGPAINGMRVPILGMDLSPALLIAGLTLAASVWLLHRLLDTPAKADLLIETEAELKKVTWPSMNDAVQGSVVVIITVLFLMAFLAGADWFIGNIARMILLGKS